MPARIAGKSAIAQALRNAGVPGHMSGDLALMVARYRAGCHALDEPGHEGIQLNPGTKLNRSRDTAIVTMLNGGSEHRPGSSLDPDRGCISGGERGIERDRHSQRIMQRG